MERLRTLQNLRDILRGCRPDCPEKYDRPSFNVGFAEGIKKSLHEINAEIKIAKVQMREAL